MSMFLILFSLIDYFVNFRYAFGLGKRDPYAFGLGKRDPYAFGLGKRDPYAFGLGKRDPYSFGLGKKWSVIIIIILYGTPIVLIYIN